MLTEKDTRKPTNQLFDPAACEVTGLMSEGLIQRLYEMEKRLKGAAPGKISNEQALSAVSMQALIVSLCSYTLGAFDSKVDLPAVLARVARTWTEMVQANELTAIGEEAQRKGMS